ncbi:MAG: C40 family peptidase [Acidobacteria bacterium]|nr:C40 family peptidase [Acidobacteriota bacterium]
MRQAYRLVVCLLAVFGTLAFVGQAEAQDRLRISGRQLAFNRERSTEFSRSFSPGNNSNMPTRNNIAHREREFKAQLEASLYGAIRDRLGAPYRSGGTDDRGYDCSGFVWRVFQEVGIDLTRASARSLWNSLPKATADEESEFGTLVFFEGLTHVGIVRDGYSFYHSSTSQGVIRSFYTGYWGGKVIGYRRVPLPRIREANRR